MRLKYIDNLFMEAETVTSREIQEVADLQVEVTPAKEDMVGVLPESLRKLSVVMMRRGDELKEFVHAESSKPRTNDVVFELKRLTDFLAKVDFLNHRLEALRSFFWESVSSELNTTEDGLGINRKWEVYFVNPKCKNCGARHSKESEPGPSDPGLDELFGALGRNPGAFFGRGGNA